MNKSIPWIIAGIFAILFIFAISSKGKLQTQIKAQASNDSLRISSLVQDSTATHQALTAATDSLKAAQIKAATPPAAVVTKKIALPVNKKK